MSLSTGEADGDPSWEELPSGAYDEDACRLTGHIAGTDLSGSFTDDFDGVTREDWDMGMEDY